MVSLSPAHNDALLYNANLDPKTWDPQSLRQDSRPQPYPLDRLPEVIGGAVAEVADYVQAPVALVAASAMSIVSAVVQGHFSVSRDRHLHGPASLFFLTAAESGERKSSVDKMFMRPLVEWEARQRATAKREEKEYKLAMEVWEGSSKDGEPPEKPVPIPTMLRGEDTSEALVVHLDKHATAAIISAEAGVIFGGASNKADNVQRNLALANGMWDGGPIIEGRLTRGEVFVPSVRVTMGLMVQPGTLNAFLQRTNGMARDIGFLARFLFSQPETTQGTRAYKAPSEMFALAEFHTRVDRLLSTRIALDCEKNIITNHMRFSEDAQFVWVEFHDQCEKYMATGSIFANMRDVASKAADNAARIACCYQAFEDPSSTTITAKNMRDACSIMRWHLEEARRFISKADVTQEVLDAELLENWLIEQFEKARREKSAWSMTINTVRKMGPNALRVRHRLDGAVTLLKDYGRIRVMKYLGSKSEYVCVAPQLWP